MKDEIKAVAAVGSFFAFLEKAMIAFFMMFMERAKIREKKAEDNAANSEAEKNIAIGQAKIDMETKGKTDAEVIDDFLDGTDTSSSSPSTGNGTPEA